jgi:carbon monoxide dehydrogenase subunit G
VKLSVGIEIAAPPAAVWRVLEPIEHHVEWMTDAEAITFTGGTTRGVGTTFDCVTKLGPVRLTDRMVVTEWEPAHAMGITHEGAVKGTGKFTLTPAGTGRTQFTWAEELRFPWWLAGPAGAAIAAPVLRAVWRHNLRALKTIVEGSQV